MRALAKVLQVRPILLEWTSVDQFTVLEYRSSEDHGYDKVTIFSQSALEHQTVRQRKRTLWDTLDRLAPTVVCVNGWGMQSSRAMMSWCVSRRIPAVVMSESSSNDMPRQPWKEWIKRRLLNVFSAAVVGGTNHIQYLRLLGFPAERIFTGYDVVDNEYFERSSDLARDEAVTLRASLGLPERYFLTCSRFTDKKNLIRVMAGYCEYRQKHSNPWNLVMAGDGPLRARIRLERDKLGLEEVIQLPGAVSYGRLPLFYGLSGGFIHGSTTEQWGLVVNEAMASGLPVLVSRNCGCAQDLVSEGSNGYCFDPLAPSSIAEAMLRLSSSERQAKDMGIVSRRRIQEFTPGHFALSVRRAAELAVSSPRAPVNMFDAGLVMF